MTAKRRVDPYNLFGLALFFGLGRRCHRTNNRTTGLRIDTAGRPALPMVRSSFRTVRWLEATELV
jgi:hypothetical protein